MRNRQGFSLIELLVVIVVLAILMGIAIPTFMAASQRSKDNKIKTQLQSAYGIVQSAYEDNETTPNSSIAPAGFTATDIAYALAHSEAQDSSFSIAQESSGAAIQYAQDKVFISIPDANSIVLTDQSESGKAFCLAVRERSGNGVDFGGGSTDSGLAQTSTLYGPSQGTPLGGGGALASAIHYWSSSSAATSAGCTPQGTAPPNLVVACDKTDCNSDTTSVSPTNGSPPSLGGAQSVGSLLSVDNGQWSGTPTSYTYQWYRCNKLGSNPSLNTAGCLPINNANSPTYSLTTIDANSQTDNVPDTVYAVVTAINGVGNASSTSNSLSVYMGGSGTIPIENSYPQLSGTTTLGQTLTYVSGNWNPSSGITFSYGWYRCNSSGSSCNVISGANNAQNYTLTGADTGSRIEVIGTAQLSPNTINFYTPLTATIN
jgi:type IV pilus assembly protein PilA